MKKCFLLMGFLILSSLLFAQAGPSASYSFYPKSAKTGETVNFYGNTSYDVDGEIVQYNWDFGDGTTAEGSVVAHQFADVDNHTVTLTVIDDEGQSSTLVQHVSVPLKGSGVREPGNIEFEEDLEGFEAAEGILSLSDEQVFVGTGSLKWEISAAEGGFYEAALDRDLGISKGSEVLFRIWVPENAEIDWIQPFVLPHTADWSFNKWHGAWKSYDSLTKGAWNDFSLVLKSDLPDGLVHKLGVQMSVKNPCDFSLYIDSIDWPDGMSGDVDINIDFEESTEEFSTANGSLSLSSAPVQSGANALRWDLLTDSAGVAEIFIDRSLGIVNGSNVVFWVWIPEDAPINWVQPFVMPHNEDYSFTPWHGAWKSYDSLTPGAWNEFSLTLGADLPLNMGHKLGVQVAVTESSAFTLYIDAIDWPEGSVPPFASFDYDVDRPAVGEVILFDAAGSDKNNLNAHDVDGAIVEYLWDLGDGTTASGSSVTHAYSAPGKYAVTLSVKDNDGYAHSVVRVVWCDQEELPFAPPLAVQKTDIVDSLGNSIVPTGFAIIDTQVFTKADFEYMKKEWKVEILRLPLITTRWYYVNDAAREAYLSNIDDYLDWTYELGIYVMFDGWHEGGQGNELEEWEACKDAWHILMQRYADREHVLWEAFNEPHHTSWEEWAPMAEELIDIIRSYDPVVKACGVPGVVWAQSLDVTVRPIDREEVFYMVHPYPQAYGATWTTERWDQEFGYIVQEGFGPVFNTEFNYPLFDHGDRLGYGEAIYKYQEMRNISWLGWIYGGWEGPVASSPKADISDGFRLFWEYFNGVWSPDYNLEVAGGSGDGAYKAGEIVEINWETAQPEPHLMVVFDGWKGDTQYLTDPSSSTTSVTIPKDDIMIEASYYVIDLRITLEYQTSQWDKGFITTIIITNNTTQPINGWELEFSFPGNNLITESWSCEMEQQGCEVDMTNVFYNEKILPGENVTVGFQGIRDGVNTAPDRFKLNGSYIKIVE